MIRESIIFVFSFSHNLKILINVACCKLYIVILVKEMNNYFFLRVNEVKTMTWLFWHFMSSSSYIVMISLLTCSLRLKVIVIINLSFKKTSISIVDEFEIVVIKLVKLNTWIIIKIRIQMYEEIRRKIIVIVHN